MRLTLVLALVASLPRLGGSGVDSAATVITGRVRAAVMLMLPDRQRRPCGIAVRLRGGQGAEGAAAAQIRAVLGRRSALLGPVCSLPGVGDAEGSEGTRAPLHAAESGATDRKLAGAGHAVGAKTCADITLQGSTAGADHEREVSGAQHIARSWEQQMKDVFEASEEQERAEQLAKARAALAVTITYYLEYVRMQMQLDRANAMQRLLAWSDQAGLPCSPQAGFRVHASIASRLARSVEYWAETV
jgi:hypothetical protein